MNMFNRIIAVGIAALYMHAASAYEILTHGKLSEAAYDQSGLNKDTQLLQNLGLKSSDTFPNSENPRPRTIKELISDGARFEDNNIRSLFHFFDPLNDDGLLFFTSPTWALEDKGKIHLLQNYSFGDARDHLYKALTLSNTEERKKYFGETFESLSRVVHHLHDMTQPQHVRLDPHLNLDWTREELPFENRSRFELYTDKPEVRDNLPFADANYNPNNSVRFDTARKFWHTANKNPKDGQGIAEFTNLNFLSAGTNFDTDRYPDPERLLGPSAPIPFQALLLGEERYASGSIQDERSGT